MARRPAGTAVNGTSPSAATRERNRLSWRQVALLVLFSAAVFALIVLLLESIATSYAH